MRKKIRNRKRRGRRWNIRSEDGRKKVERKKRKKNYKNTIKSTRRKRKKATEKVE